MIPAWTARRRLVPRWRSVALTTAAGELSVVGSSRAPPGLSAEMKARMADWRRAPSLLTAAELMESAIVDGEEAMAVAAARRVFFHDDNAAPLVKRQAAQLLRQTGHANELPEDAVDEPRHPTAMWRARTRLYPHDALAWTELALHHTIYGHLEPAARAMKVAIQLAGDNRHVLRSGARFFLHANDPERAHDLLVKSPATSSDPWLVAAEVSVAQVADRSPRMIKAARNLQSGDFSARILSELSGTLATLELEDGSQKKARKLFSQSVIDPTGNALAQAEWALPLSSASFIPESRFQSVREAGEANAFRAYVRGEYRDVIAACERWAAEEPYSIRPFEFGAAVSGYVGLYDEAISLALRGLKARPGAPKLINALVFALASVDRLDEAEKMQSTLPVSMDEFSKNVATANRGLIYFRKGEHQRGYSLYKEAITEFFRTGEKYGQAGAKVYLAREAMRVGYKDAEKLLDDAQRAWKVSSPDEQHPAISKILAERERLAGIKKVLTSATQSAEPAAGPSWRLAARLPDRHRESFTMLQSGYLVSRVDLSNRVKSSVISNGVQYRIQSAEPKEDPIV